MKRDSEVEQRVLRTLKLDSSIACREVCVESQLGVVKVSGTTPTSRERAAVYEATRGTPGVRSVVNKIEVGANRSFIPEKLPGANASAPPLNVLVSTSSEASIRAPHAPQQEVEGFSFIASCVSSIDDAPGPVIQILT